MTTITSLRDLIPKLKAQKSNMPTNFSLMATSMCRFRPLSYAAGSVMSSSTLRLVPQPPDLINWVRKEGGFVHKAVKIAHQIDPSLGLGLVATEDIPKGSELILLPKHIPLSFGAFEAGVEDGSHPALVKLAQHVPEELWSMKLGLKLLQERAKKGSFWWPYISNLPETYSVPIFFPGDDIRNLQYAPLLYQVNKRCRFLLDFEKIVKSELKNFISNSHPFEGQDVDASALGWAMSAVSSRAFRFYGKKQPDGTHLDVPVMLPLVDMCNHSFNPNAEIIQEEEYSNGTMLVKVVSRCQIKEADALELNYGNLNNDLFLLDYGFVVSSNPYDCIELKYDPALLDAASTVAGVTNPNFSSPTPWQRHILSQLNLDKEDSQAKVSLGGQELVEGRLLAALRVCLSNEEAAVRNIDINLLKSTSAESPLGVPTDVAALRTLIALCIIGLEHFPTKIMEDESLLKQNVSASSELAIKFRIQKKSLLINVMRELTRRVKLLQSKELSSVQ